MGCIYRGRFLFILAAFLLALPVPGRAAEVNLGGENPLSLERAVELALNQSFSLRQSYIDLGTAEYAAAHLWSEIFPGISAGLGLSYGTGLLTGDGFRLNGTGAGYSLSAGINLSLNAGLPYRMKSLELARQIRLLSYEDARRQLEIQVAKSFYNLIAEKKNLDYLRELLALAEKQREKDRIAFENGFLGELGYQRSRLSTETAKLSLIRAEAAYAARLREFLAALGLEEAAEPEGLIEITRIDADPESLIREYLPKRPDIQRQRQTITGLEYTQKQGLLSSRAPSLSLSAQWRGSPGSGGISGEFSDNISGSISLSIPVDPWIPGTKNDQSIRSAGAELEKARLELKNLEIRTANEIRSLAANLKNSWESIEASRFRLELAERTYELTEGGFQQGAVEFLTLEDARNSMTEARQQLLNEELAYQTMTLDLAAALNIDWKEIGRSIP
ncbi:MAG: TolC family protein [Treponema sp.]|nr:TolC family protein [Treponema sp.]